MNVTWSRHAVRKNGWCEFGKGLFAERAAAIKIIAGAEGPLPQAAAL